MTKDRLLFHLRQLVDETRFRAQPTGAEMERRGITFNQRPKLIAEASEYVEKAEAFTAVCAFIEKHCPSKGL
jgi:hypothetical protein